MALLELCARRGLTQVNRAQTLPETSTTASNKATNTSSLSNISIGMPRSQRRCSLSADSPDDGAPHPGGKHPRW